MVHKFDLSKDLLLVDGLDTFVLKVEDAEDIVLQESVLTEPVDTHEPEPTAGQVIQMDTLAVWPIFMSPTRPPLGSVLVDSDNTYWTILAVRRKQHVECWEARCRDLSIIPSIANEATLLEAVYGKGDAGEAKPTWRGLFSQETPPTSADVIPARFQPVGDDAMLRFLAEWTRERFRVILDRPLPLELSGGEYRIQDELGNRYRVLAYHDKERLDRLPVCECVRITEGAEFSGTTPLPPPEFPLF